MEVGCGFCLHKGGGKGDSGIGAESGLLEISTKGKFGVEGAEEAVEERGEVCGWKDVGRGEVEVEGLGRTGGAVEGAGESIVLVFDGDLSRCSGVLSPNSCFHHSDLHPLNILHPFSSQIIPHRMTLNTANVLLHPPCYAFPLKCCSPFCIFSIV